MNNKIAKVSTIDDFIYPNRILCEIIGMTPAVLKKPSKIRVCLVHFRIAFTVAAISSLFVPEILEIIHNWGNIKVLTNVGSVATVAAQLLFKVAYLVCRRDKIADLFEEIRDLWNSGNDSEDRKAIERYARQAKIFTITLFASALSNNVAFTIAAAFKVVDMRTNENNETDFIVGLPCEVWYGNDPLNWSAFKISFIGQIVSTLICCVSFVGLNAAMTTLVLHVCSQFVLIQCWFQKIGAKVKKYSSFADKKLEDEFHYDIRDEIGKCVKHHQRMLIMAKEVAELLNPIIFTQFVTSGFEICLSGFSLTNSDTSFSERVKFACWLLMVVIELLVFCWPGEILNRESFKVGEALYFDVPWYDLPKEFNLDISLVIIRSQKECSIAALSFQKMSFKTLASVFNSAASYFALLRQLVISAIDEADIAKFAQTSV